MSSYVYQSPIGKITIFGKDDYITHLYLDGQKFDKNISKEYFIDNYCKGINEAIKWLDVYFNGNVPAFTPKIKISSTKFRCDVWNMLLQIPYGKVTTYGEIAKAIALKNGKEFMSAQAVGGAVGKNPVSIIIPCHRVIGSNGNLTGYAGGIYLKKALLNYEKSIFSDIFRFNADNIINYK